MKRTLLAVSFSVWPRRPLPDVDEPPPGSRSPRRRKRLRPPRPPGRSSRASIPTWSRRRRLLRHPRYPKEQYVKARRPAHQAPADLAQPVEFFKEDDKYYYISRPEGDPGEEELLGAAEAEPPRQPARGRPTTPPAGIGRPYGGGLRGSPSASRGRRGSGSSASRRRACRRTGQWRASFRVADINGDRKLDIVSPPARIGDGQLQDLAGRRQGALLAVAAHVLRRGQAGEAFSLDYGGVAVGGHRRGRPDATSFRRLTAAGCCPLFGDGKGGFTVVRTGLPGREFSAQAIVTARDANGDGKLDIVASRDVVELETNSPSTRRRCAFTLSRGATRAGSTARKASSGASTRTA